MRQADLTFVIFTLMVVGVVDEDTENTWTTLISKYDLTLYYGGQKSTVLWEWKLLFFIEIMIL